MKYYSEKLGKLFDTEEKLREEEKTHDDRATQYHEELSKLRSEYACALNAQNEIHAAYLEARKKTQKAADAYNKKLTENPYIKNDFFYDWLRGFHEDN